MVILSVVAASLIYPFTWFYLLIPGFWCYAVGGFLLDGYYQGAVSDNHGTALRAKSPVRYWGKLALWACAYLLAAAFPIGYAIQERGKAEAADRPEAQAPAEPPAAP